MPAGLEPACHEDSRLATDARLPFRHGIPNFMLGIMARRACSQKQARKFFADYKKSDCRVIMEYYHIPLRKEI